MGKAVSVILQGNQGGYGGYSQPNDPFSGHGESIDISDDDLPFLIREQVTTFLFGSKFLANQCRKDAQSSAAKQKRPEILTNPATIKTGALLREKKQTAGYFDSALSLEIEIIKSVPQSWSEKRKTGSFRWEASSDGPKVT